MELQMVATIAGSLCKSRRIWTQVLTVDQASYPLIFFFSCPFWNLPMIPGRNTRGGWVYFGSQFQKAQSIVEFGWHCDQNSMVYSLKNVGLDTLQQQTGNKVCHNLPWPTPWHSPLVFIPSLKVAPSPSNMPLAREQVFKHMSLGGTFLCVP